METNVTKNSNQNPIPAGIISGMEGFWDEQTQTKWLGINGEWKPFDQHPAKIQDLIVEIFRNDTFNRNYLQKIGITAFQAAFDRWWKCIVGGLDSVPDFSSKGVEPDSFINTCNDMNCPDRGKLCGRKSLLKNFQVQTIRVLEQGNSIKESAVILCVSIPSMKKRIETINSKLNTRNMASMIATSCRLGII